MLGPVPDVATARDAERLHQREEDPAGASRDGRDRGSQESLAEDEAVAESEGGAPEEPDELVGDAVAEAGLDEAAGEEEGEGDEPGDGVSEGGEGGGER